MKKSIFFIFLLTIMGLSISSVKAESKLPIIILPLIDNTRVDVGFVSNIYRKTTTKMYTEVINKTFGEEIEKRFPQTKYEIMDLKTIEALIRNEGYDLDSLDLPDRMALKNITIQTKARGIIVIEFFQFGTNSVPFKPNERPWMLSCRLRTFDSETNLSTNLCYQGSIVEVGSGEDDKHIGLIVKDLVTKTMDQVLMKVAF